MGVVASGQALSQEAPQVGASVGTSLKSAEIPTPQLDKADPTVEIKMAAAHSGQQMGDSAAVGALRSRRQQLIEMLTAERSRYEKSPAALRGEIQEHIDWLEGRVSRATASLRNSGVGDAVLASDEAVAMRAAGGAPVTVMVKSVSFSGNDSIPGPELQSVVSDSIGRTLSFTQINELAARVTKHYRDSGYVVARAYLPAQEIQGGHIQIGVLEGAVGDVKVANDSRLKDGLAEKYLEPLKSGGALTQAQLERHLLLLNDLAGIKVSSVLKPGAAVGETEVDVAVSDTQHFTGSVDLNNYGSDATGTYRLGGTFNINNLIGHGDMLQFRGFASDSGDTWFASLGWTVPISTRGTALGLRYAYMRGDVGEEFAALGIETSAELLSAYLVHPIVRSRRYNIYGQVGYDYKDIREEWDPLLGVKSKDHLDVGSIAFSGDIRDGFAGGGLSTFHVGLYHGMSNLEAPTTSDPDAEGQFMKTSFEVTRLQRVARNSNIYARLAGQYTTDRLVSSEQWSLGGPNGVRAYPSGEGLADAGYVLTAEWQQNFPGGSWQNIFDVSQVYAFVDIGEGKLNNTKSDQSLRYDRSGAGIGLKIGRTHDFLVNMNYAWTLGDKEATTTTDNGQFWLQAVKWFE